MQIGSQYYQNSTEATRIYSHQVAQRAQLLSDDIMEIYTLNHLMDLIQEEWK